jgi:hypothetical protein
MALVVKEIKNLVLEKRIKSIYIYRDLNSENITVTIRGSTGFYDENYRWKEVEETTLTVKDDDVLFLMGLSSSQLGTDKIGEMISKAAYGILSGAIPLSCTLNVISNVNGIVKINKNGTNIYQIPTNTPFKLPILVNVTVSVESSGHKTYTTTLPILQGEIILNVNLEPEDPEGSGEDGSDNVNEGSESRELSEPEDTTILSDSNSESESEKTSP